MSASILATFINEEVAKTEAGFLAWQARGSWLSNSPFNYSSSRSSDLSLGLAYYTSYYRCYCQ